MGSMYILLYFSNWKSTTWGISKGTVLDMFLGFLKQICKFIEYNWAYDHC